MGEGRGKREEGNRGEGRREKGEGRGMGIGKALSRTVCPVPYVPPPEKDEEREMLSHQWRGWRAGEATEESIVLHLCCSDSWRPLVDGRWEDAWVEVT